MSDPSPWWPGGREGTSGPGGREGTSGPIGGGGPSDGGTYYYPPGTTPGARRPNGAGPTRPRRGVSPQRWLWVAIGIGVVLLLFHAHRINEIDVILFCVLIPSIILHEIAHGWVALAFGDDTAKRAGRLTLNPLAHIDIVGTVIVPILLIWSGFGFFGWAKPVPVNVGKLRSPRNQGVLVSLAGPATNIVLCVVAAVAFRVFGGIKATEGFGPLPVWVLVLIYLGLVNLWLAVFNMIPIPPLDGSVLIERMLPGSWWPRYLELRRYTLPVVLIVVVLASYIHDGNTTLIGHLSGSVENWWLGVLGVH
ncbi:MAG TPA: site-2 protease family protein [Acidimicrobiales bacterium]|nr:site-2 protease family protein [Acidimicrobiales bacterium]